MEIHNFPPPSTIAPIRAPSKVEDGDAGSNSPYYRRRQKKQKGTQNQQAPDPSPRLEGSPSRIDIRV